MVEKKPTKKKTVKKKKAAKSSKKRTDNKSDGTLKLSPVLAINDAGRIYTQFDKLIQSQQDVSIDASEVEMVDTAILQILVAFIRKMQSQNTKTSWDKPSKEFVSRAATLGLIETLGITEAQR